jgi:hypothetical protein
MSTGTVFDLEESGKGAWFDMEGGGRVQLRTLTAYDFKEIRKQTVKSKTEYKRIDGKAERFDVDVVDEELQNALFWDHCIVNWENLFDSKNNPIPCNKENKIILMERSLKFSKFVGECLRKLNEDEAEQTTVLEKN